MSKQQADVDSNNFNEENYNEIVPDEIKIHSKSDENQGDNNESLIDMQRLSECLSFPSGEPSKEYKKKESSPEVPDLSTAEIKDLSAKKLNDIENSMEALKLGGMHQGPAKTHEEAARKHFGFWDTKPVLKIAVRADSPTRNKFGPMYQRPLTLANAAPSQIQGGTTHHSKDPSAHTETQGGTPQPLTGLLKEFQMSMPDNKLWREQLFGLLQSQCKADGFTLMCKVIQQSIVTQVNWAKNSVFFEELEVDDQIKLLQQSWSAMLVLDHLHRRLHTVLPEEISLPNGHKFSMAGLALLGVASMQPQLEGVVQRLRELQFDPIDYICLKFLLLLNPAEARFNIQLVHEAYEWTQQSLMEYTLSFYPHINDKFGHLLAVLPEIHVISGRGEDHLLCRHRTTPLPSLLLDMMHTRLSQERPKTTKV